PTRALENQPAAERRFTQRGAPVGPRERGEGVIGPREAAQLGEGAGPEAAPRNFIILVERLDPSAEVGGPPHDDFGVPEAGDLLDADVFAGFEEPAGSGGDHGVTATASPFKSR